MNQGIKRRNAVFRELGNIGQHVQYSVFECNLTVEALRATVCLLAELVDEAEDSVRIYPICRACVPQTRHAGMTPASWDQGYIIV